MFIVRRRPVLNRGAGSFSVQQPVPIQVAVRLEPTFVDLNRQRPDEPETTLRVGEDTDHMGPALELLIEAFEHIGAFDVYDVPWGAGKK